MNAPNMLRNLLDSANVVENLSAPVKLAMATGLGALTTASVVIADRHSSHESQMRLETHDALSHQIEMVNRLVSELVSDADKAEMTLIARQFIDHTEIDALVVQDKYGRMLVELGPSSDLIEVAARDDLDILSEGRVNLGSRLYFAQPLHLEGAEGVVILARTSKLNEELRSNHSLIAPAMLTILAALALALAIYVLARKLETPIEQLSAHLAEIRPGGADAALDKLATVAPSLADAMMVLVGRYEAAIFTHKRAAITDPVSGLMNRIHFMQLIDEKIRQYGERNVVLALVDINRFRRINDQIGVKLADELLALIGRRLRDNLEKADRALRPDTHASAPCQVGRLNGDQFGIIIPLVDESLACDIVQNMQRSFNEPFELAGKPISVSVSASAASSPDDASNGPDLVKQAELAMHHAKLARVKSPYFYNRDLAEQANQRLHLEEEVRRGIENREFIAVFQPKVDLRNGQVIGAEALARWRRPDGSAVSPGRFIPIAEELGLISKLGISVLRDACVEAALWNRGSNRVRVAVNVSPHQFEDPEFIPSIYEAIEESGLDPELLELEITESVAVENPEKVTRIMRPLRARGVRLAIDDFGTGHSNFTTVTRLPFDVFKIDQQFVRALSQDPHAPAIIEMILAMAEALGQETVAEGVEDVQQFEFLRRRGCTIGQGYYFSPPLPGHEFRSFVKHWELSASDARLSGTA